MPAERDALSQMPLASDNERMILDVLRRHGAMARSTITSHTNLTQQSVHRLVEGLVERGLLRTGAPIGGMRGQPSPTIELARGGASAIGLSVNTDSVVLCITDLACDIIVHERMDLNPSDRETTLQAISTRLDALLEQYRVPKSTLAGLGFSMSGFFVSEDRAFNAPEPLADWSLRNLRPELEQAFGLPVWLENNATTAAIGESMRGVGLWCRTFAFLSFNYGFGGGLILDGKPFHGFHGNAGEFSGIYIPGESERRPALQYLLARLQENGIDIDSVEVLRRDFDPSWPGVEAWLTDTMPQVDRLIATLVAVLDPQAIVFGGQLPPALGRMMIARAHLPSARIHRYGIGPPEAQLVLSETAGDPAAIGAAVLPLKLRYFA
ncbi:putative NBD/HSP70 family sugar kinase [Rhizobium sp. PP-F2F-G48]|uniref:ROK family transcriptional regulator n=1 Tax=Rhizobium sp. PP-F2F-G48 TaxID=2135651 RepID=UPI00104A9D64|nr:ROK family transcriptional regulator [Rhizobium sp. PP-F2F-G48]TCM52219.1 putative NBD/HSP70 family sugar kinase [Rhizobium sp. PP-F2F-G48]